MSWGIKKLSAVLSILVLAMIFSPIASANDTVSKLDKMKAAYILNFMLFIEWPNNQEDGSLTPLYICLQDSTPFEQFLRSLASITSAKNPAKKKLYVSTLSDAQRCDLTYFHQTPDGEKPQVEDSVVVLSSEQVLQKDAAIIFFISDDQLRFEIAMNNISKFDITVSSELLKLARLK
jgi:hypothetical protein